MTHQHEKRYNNSIERLRNPERVALLEVERVVELTLQHLPQTVSVLDIGTGSGLFAECFSAHGAMVSGVDANSEMLVEAAKFVPAAEFRQGIAEELPFEDSSFDVVFMGVVFHETDERLKALQEAFRVARRRTAILEWLYEEGTHGPPLAHRVQSSEIAELARQAGFNAVENLPLKNLMLYRLDKD